VVRFTIHDTEKTVSFVGEERLARYLVAACAVEPAALEELLVAAEPYAPGTTAFVMHGLLRFDAQHAPKHAAAWPHDEEPGTDVLHQSDTEVVEVVDGETAELARTPEDGGLLSIDLEERRISGWVAAEEPIAAWGTLDLSAHDPGRHSLVFALGGRWVVTLQTAIDRASVREGDLHA
jgi:hypothetical protein